MPWGCRAAARARSGGRCRRSRQARGRAARRPRRNRCDARSGGGFRASRSSAAKPAAKSPGPRPPGGRRPDRRRRARAARSRRGPRRASCGARQRRHGVLGRDRRVQQPREWRGGGAPIGDGELDAIDGDEHVCGSYRVSRARVEREVRSNASGIQDGVAGGGASASLASEGADASITSAGTDASIASSAPSRICSRRSTYSRTGS